ncbi:MAG: ABC transporter permease subunit [Acidipropionibacterium sp.]|jgi:peptide/nickel transport system permease protein|nr:ABC transporter permease subunit [Acidipropionibacterium sp.]
MTEQTTRLHDGRGGKGRRGRKTARPTITTVLAAAGLLVAVVIATVGRRLAAHTPTQVVGTGFQAPSAGLLLGTDAIGRDVAARVLYGGGRILLTGLIAAALTVLAGLGLALVSAFAGAGRGEWIIRLVDMIGVIPGLLVLLLLGTGLPGSDVAVAAAIALVSVPFSTRVLRTVLKNLLTTGYVEVARSRGDRWWQLVRHDIAPGLAVSLATESGLRLTSSLQLAATAGFLGLGQGPPAADWGRMVQENAVGVLLNPWGVVVPAVLLAVVIMSVNFLVDDLGRRLQTTSGAA